MNLINVHDTPLQVYKGKTLGSLHPAKHISTIRSDKRNSHRKRNKSSKILTVADIPEHTRAVLDVADELTVEQTSEVCELILEDTERFVKNDGKTGNTDWVEHGVNVQPPPTPHPPPQPPPPPPPPPPRAIGIYSYIQ